MMTYYLTKNHATQGQSRIKKANLCKLNKECFLL